MNLRSTQSVNLNHRPAHLVGAESALADALGISGRRHETPTSICCWLAGVDSQTYTDSNQNTQGKRISLAKLLMFRESCGSFESNPAV
jgi:hypothetical protein